MGGETSWHGDFFLLRRFLPTVAKVLPLQWRLRGGGVAMPHGGTDCATECRRMICAGEPTTDWD